MIEIPAQYLVDDEGRKTAVLLPIHTYEQMLEDLHDLAIVAQRREEKPINLEEMLERLGIQNELQPPVQTGG
jgi:hypothetical protein